MNDPSTTKMRALPARSVLLTVVCILSFIIGMRGMYKGFHGLMADQRMVVQQAEEAAVKERATIGGALSGRTVRIIESGLDMTKAEAANATPLGIGRLLVFALILIGAGLMWSLRRTGFWLYVLGSVGGLALRLAYSGGGMMATINLAVLTFISLIFIILYAVNLKYMH